MEAAADPESLSSWVSWGDSASNRVAASPLRKPLGHLFPWPYLPMATCGQSHAWPICFHHMLPWKDTRDISSRDFVLGWWNWVWKQSHAAVWDSQYLVHLIQTLVKFVEEQGPNINGMGLVGMPQKNGTQITLWEHSLQLKTRYIKV